MAKKNPVAIDVGNQCMRCLNCGWVGPLVYGDIPKCTRMMTAMCKPHDDCKPGDTPRVWFSKPAIPITEKP